MLAPPLELLLSDAVVDGSLQYDAVVEAAVQVLPVPYWVQSASVEQPGTQALPPAVITQRLPWPTLLIPHCAVDTQGWVHQVP